MQKKILSIKNMCAFILFAYVLPVVVFSADPVKGIVPCGPGSGPGGVGEAHPCTLNDLAGLINEIINFLVKMTVPLAAVAFAIGGGFMIFGVANPSNIDKGKEIMKYAVWGMLTVFTAWILVNTLLIALGFNPNFSLVK